MADSIVCRACGKEKSLEEFYQRAEGGHYRTCKRCRLEYQRRPDRQEARRRAWKKYDASPKGKAGIKARALRHTERRVARLRLNTAIYQGRIARGPCEVCGATEDVHGHHDDYSKPLQVRWLCRYHHHREHGAPPHAEATVSELPKE